MLWHFQSQGALERGRGKHRGKTAEQKQRERKDKEALKAQEKAQEEAARKQMGLSKRAFFRRKQALVGPQRTDLPRSEQEKFRKWLVAKSKEPGAVASELYWEAKKEWGYCSKTTKKYLAAALQQEASKEEAEQEDKDRVLPVIPYKDRKRVRAKGAGKPSLYAAALEAARVEVATEEGRGHCLEPADVLTAFTLDLQAEQKDLADLGDSLTEEQKNRKGVVDKKLTLLAEKEENRRKTRDWVCDQIGYKARKIQDLNQLSFEEKGMIMRLTWQSWENLLWTCSVGREEELQKVVSKPKEWMANLPSTKCVFSDAIPVYCQVAGGPVLVSKADLAEMEYRKKVKRKRGRAPPAKLHSMTAGTGKARDLKDRLTLLARQSLEGLFGQPGQPRLRSLKGKVLQSILIVHCNSRVRLENIEDRGKTGYWIEDEHFWQNGKEEVRKAGEKVPPQLMRPWRELRKKRPGLFSQGVLVWGHPTAYMDEVICDWHSLLCKEECRDPDSGSSQVLLSQDSFAGELTLTCLSKKFLRQQVQHVIGPHVTGRLQLTDTTFAQPAKQAADMTKSSLRKRLRSLAAMQKVPVKHKTGSLEILQVALSMHADMRKREGKIVPALRAAHFLDFLPSSEGLVPVSPEEASIWPAGGHRVDPLWSEDKTGWMQPLEGSAAFQPLPCDWSDLNRLRREQEGLKEGQEPDSESRP